MTLIKTIDVTPAEMAELQKISAGIERGFLSEGDAADKQLRLVLQADTTRADQATVARSMGYKIVLRVIWPY